MLSTRFLIPISLLVLGALLAACASPAAVPTLDGTQWQLQQLNGEELPLGVWITLNFSDGAIGGNAACNGYGGDYTQNGNQITFSEIFSTMMYCENVMDYEQAYLAALDSVRSFAVSGEQLLLQNESGEALLVFGSQQEAPSLAGSAWIISQAADLAIPAEVEATLGFADGQINGRAACNSYFADYTQEGFTLAIGPAGATKMFCEGLMDYESAILSSLEQVRSFEFQMGNLVMLGETGSILLILTPAQ